MSDLVKRLRGHRPGWDYRDDWAILLEAADEIERLQKDAKRYRWLRDNAGCPFAETDDAWDGGEKLDEAIDAAMKGVSDE